MEDYYRNAYVTIAAIDAKNTTEGFLHHRNTYSVLLSKEHNIGIRARPRLLEQVYNDSVLETRAWCFQERLLSTRILQFGKSELFWECQTESHRESRSRLDLGDTTAMHANEKMANHNLKRGLKSNKSLAAWYTIVEQYSNRG